MLKFLFIEDNDADYELAIHELRNYGFQFSPIQIEGKAEFQEHLNKVDVIFADCGLPGFDCTNALSVWKSRGLDEVPFIILSGTITKEQAVVFQDLGATDVVLKENLNRLGVVTKRALKEVTVKNQIRMTRIDTSVIHAINNALTIIGGNTIYCLCKSSDINVKNSLKTIDIACAKIAKILRGLGDF